MLRIPTATSAADLHRALEDYRVNSPFRAERIKLAEVDAVMFASPKSEQLWRRQRSGDVARGDGLFFELTGARVFPQGPGHGFYDQPVIAEPATGTVALVCDRETGDVLVEMKPEPGTDAHLNHVSFAPTLQTSLGRRQLAHANKNEALPTLWSVLLGLGLFHDDAFVVHQDGGRFWGKRNTYDVVMAPNKQSVDALANGSMIWTKVAYLGAEENRNDLNSHLMQVLAAQALLDRHSAL